MNEEEDPFRYEVYDPHTDSYYTHHIRPDPANVVRYSFQEWLAGRKLQPRKESVTQVV